MHAAAAANSVYLRGMNLGMQKKSEEKAHMTSFKRKREMVINLFRAGPEFSLLRSSLSYSARLWYRLNESWTPNESDKERPGSVSRQHKKEN